MKLKNIYLGSVILSSILFAGGDIVPVEPKVMQEAPVASTWSYEFEPYILIASMSGTSQIGRTPALEIDVDFGTILEKLDIGAMAHFEAHNENGWGLWLDYGFMDLSSDISGPLGIIRNARVRQGILEAFGMYRQPLANGYVDYLAGIRWWDNDFDIDYDFLSMPGSVNIDEDWIDPVIGARWSIPINENWKFSLLGTLGGFGVGSDFSAGGNIGFKYVINDLLDLDLQYKVLWADYETGTRGEADYFSYDVTTYGPCIGLNFKF